jgi:Arc/MetJ-type ribon-helix-helix transcriptional regulator
MAKRTGLKTTMTEEEFENGYWYATELQEFATRVGIPSAKRLRKDELENALKHFLRSGERKNLVRRGLSKSGVRDLDRGLRLDLPVVHYTSNKETRDFIVREAAKLEPGFKRASGTRYLLNRWREEQVSSGRRITYADLVKQALRLNKTKRGPLRMAHGRYINFISDFMAAHRDASHAAAVRAWKAIKALDAPKTYEAWAKIRKA